MSRRSITFNDELGLHLPVAEDPAADNRVELDRMKSALRWAIREHLTPLERKELTLYYVDGLTYAAIGAATGTCPSTVMRNVRRAVKKLEKSLGCLTAGRS